MTNTMSDKIWKILVVDDQEEILYSLQAVFEYQGWKGITAQDVLTGVSLFEQEKPDLVLMDYHLPRVSGIRGVEMIRALDEEVPIIVFTIDESQEIAEQFRAVGASDFALKPIKVPDILSRIRLHMRLIESQQSMKKLVDKQSKGIDKATLMLVRDCLAHASEPLDAETIARETGLASKTVYRYIQHLITEKKVESFYSYGKVGRPKQRFSLLKEEPEISED